MGKNRGAPKIKNVQKTHSINKNKIDTPNYPVFCFKHLQDISIKNSIDVDFFRNFLFRLKQLAELGWKEIEKAPRHGFGVERIPIKELKPTNYPPIITPDITHLTVFRAGGNNRPFLGVRNSDIFHVIFIETKFGDIYDHKT
jgi:hypothetical protein